MKTVDSSFCSSEENKVEITYSEIRKNKKKYWDLYGWIKDNRRPPTNLKRYMTSIDKKWEEILCDNSGERFGFPDQRDNDEANLLIFSQKMGATFGWPDPINGHKYIRKDPVWWLLVGWWWYILKGFYKVLMFIGNNAGKSGGSGSNHITV